MTHIFTEHFQTLDLPKMGTGKRLRSLETNAKENDQVLRWTDNYTYIQMANQEPAEDLDLPFFGK